MGDNFHGVDALERCLGIQLSRAYMKLFLTLPFTPELLQQCAETHVLVACGPLSLLDVWQAQTGLFYTKNEPWYGAQSEQWARTKVKAGWHLIRKSAVPDSISKTWDMQNRLLKTDEQVPSASVLAQAALIHYLETTQEIFEAIYVRCSDMDPDRNHVYIGLFDEDGLGVHACEDSFRNGSLGLASSRMFC